MTIPILENIALHSLTSADAVDVYNTIVSQREYLGEWLPFVALTNSIDFTQSFVDSAVNAPSESFEPIFTIRQEKELVGFIGFKSTDRANHKTEIGYWLSQHHQGKGIITRTVKELCRYSFSELGINRVQIKCAVGNKRSIAIPKRLGFTFEGIERAGELNSDGRYFDIEIDSILKSEFI